MGVDENSSTFPQSMSPNFCACISNFSATRKLAQLEYSTLVCKVDQISYLILFADQCSCIQLAQNINWIICCAERWSTHYTNRFTTHMVPVPERVHHIERPLQRARKSSIDISPNFEENQIRLLQRKIFRSIQNAFSKKISSDTLPDSS